jgi:hypothetical protein
MESDGRQRFVADGEPGWRLRFTPMDGGAHRVTLSASLRGQARGAVSKTFQAKASPLKGFLRVNPRNSSYLALADGSPFVAIGWNASWWHTKGLADYEAWADKMAASGMNYVRLWMAPWAFGIESDLGTLGRYALDRAWALDHVLEVLRKRGIHVILCFEYHGMLQTTKDFWQSNDNWKINPYNAANGGPARTQNEFFTSPEARRLYQQRLRYIVSRWGAYPNVGVWEFWNEIDNVRQHYQEGDMIAWHRDMAREVRRLDPYGRLVSSSLTHDGSPDFWTKPAFDLIQFHSYNQANPGVEFAARARKAREMHGKPYIVGEYGVDFRAPKLEDDPKSRGLKQALWGSLLGGGAGTAQSWWWETLHAQNIYPVYRSLSQFASQVPFGAPGWAPREVEVPGEPTELPPAVPGGKPFTARIPLMQSWGAQNSGLVLVTDASGSQGQGSRLNGFLHGTSKPELRRPFVLKGRFSAGARVGVMVNSVSDFADLRILVDGKEAAARAFPDKDGKTESTGEYGETLWAEVPPGTRTVEVRNVGRDWASLDWVEVQGALPSNLPSDAATPVWACATGDGQAAALWVQDPAFSYPANAKEPVGRMVANSWVRLKDMKPGRYTVRWWDTAGGRWASSSSVSADNQGLRLKVPPFREDIAALVRRVR